MEFIFLYSGVYGQKLKAECGLALFSLLNLHFNHKLYSNILVVVSMHTKIISNFIKKHNALELRTVPVCESIVAVSVR